MVSQGVYREGGAVGGLPLSRRGLRAYTAAVIGAAVLAFVGPLYAFLGVSRNVDDHLSASETLRTFYRHRIPMNDHATADLLGGEVVRIVYDVRGQDAVQELLDRIAKTEDRARYHFASYTLERRLECADCTP